MTIAIDVSRANRVQRTGPGSYAWNVVRGLVNRSQKSEVSLTLLAPDDPIAEWGTMPSNVIWKKLSWFGPGWTSVRLPLHLARQKYDVFFEPSAGLCRVPSGTKSLATLHDVSFLEAPEVYNPSDLASQRVALESGQRADKIIAVSEHTKQQLIERAGSRPEQITVTSLAADDGMAPQPLEAVRAAMEKCGIQSPYIITVGRIEKKKGIVEIVEALAQLPPDVQLVLVGPDGYGADVVRRRVAELKLEDRVKFVGWVAGSDLAALLSGATAYMSACRYEGFGIAVLDALACGCPVVAYKAGAVPEAVGDAAVLVDPSGPDHLSAGIRPLLDSPDTYHRLAKLGVERAAQFSWQKTAELTWKILTA